MLWFKYRVGSEVQSRFGISGSVWDFRVGLGVQDRFGGQDLTFWFKSQGRKFRSEVHQFNLKGKVLNLSFSVGVQGWRFSCWRFRV